MENESKRRSGSFGSQKTAEASPEDFKKLSLSEGSIVDKETSPQPNASADSQESSPAGTLKKPRKFKPRKYIAKKLKLRKSDKEKSDDQDRNTAGSQSEQESIKTSSSVSSKLSEKLSSPKLQRFNFVKRFSSGKNSYRVSPISDDGGEGSKNNVKSLSVSDVSFHEENEPQNFISQVDIPLQEESVTLESKKVELKIPMAKFEKRSSSPSAFERATVDKASVEPSTDIELPSQAQAGNFYAKAPYDESQTKPIRAEDTFATVVREAVLRGRSHKLTQEENPTEVEKYSILTSSLQTILSTAKDLEEFGAHGGSDELKFPELPELRIHEEKDKVKETSENLKKSSEKSSRIQGKETTKNQPEISQEIEEKSIEKELKKITSAFNTSTPIRPEVEQEASELDESDIEESDEMKKQKKSKIPVDQKRLSASFDAQTSTSTVRTQQANNPYHVNLSSPSSEESPRLSELSPGQIKFEVGTPVRNFPSPTGSTTMLNPIAIAESSNPQESIDEIFHSPKSEKSSQPESITRRKISYVLTAYSAEEQELLQSNFDANADSSAISSFLADSVFPYFDDSLVRNFYRFVNCKESCRGRFVVTRGIERLFKTEKPQKSRSSFHENASVTISFFGRTVPVPQYLYC